MNRVIGGIVLCLLFLSLEVSGNNNNKNVNNNDNNNLNIRPIVGILTQPSSSSLKKYGPNYIAASYVKYLEGAGARVVPIHHDAPASVLKKYFENLNGVLFPGGGSDLDNTPLFNAGKTLYDLSLQAYDQSGDIFPIMGHCMGFQLLTMITSEDFDILSDTAATNITLPLDYTDLANKSRMFGDAPAKIYDILGAKPVTMNNHNYGVYPDNFKNNQKLNSFYNILSTNKDKKGVEFVSSMESKKYPIFGVQWHPEKDLYEWNPDEVTNHAPDAILSMQYMADFTVSQARKSMHHFANAEEEQHTVIYNYQPVYTFYDVDDFEQAYFFDNWH